MNGILIAVIYTVLIFWYFSSALKSLNDPKRIQEMRKKEALTIFSELSDENLKEATKRILGLACIIILLFGWLVLALIF